MTQRKQSQGRCCGTGKVVGDYEFKRRREVTVHRHTLMSYTGECKELLFTGRYCYGMEGNLI